MDEDIVLDRVVAEVVLEVLVEVDSELDKVDSLLVVEVDSEVENTAVESPPNDEDQPTLSLR